MLQKSNEMLEKCQSELGENKKLQIVQKINKEVEKMKYGSIAIVNQVRVVSKQRIHNPRTNFDILSGIKVSDTNLDLIDDMMKKLFVKK